MAASEEEIFALVHDGIDSLELGLSVELLVADSGQTHLHQVVTSGMEPGTGCSVASPGECPATIHGQTLAFESSEALDACPYLKKCVAGPRSALCVPVSIAGQPIGVMHSAAKDLELPSARSLLALELIARRTGERISMLRAFERSESEAKTDPLTGLLNRRSVEVAAQALIETGEGYAVAYGDLDHFKILNDTYGHDMGDRALRLFARVLRDSVRPSDIPARYGGEEFVVILPDCSLADAAIVMDRVHDNLVTAIRDGAGPEFTVSIGIAPSAITRSFDEIVEAADAALMEAKSSGRNRVVLAHGAGLPAPVGPVRPEPKDTDTPAAA